MPRDKVQRMKSAKEEVMAAEDLRQQKVNALVDLRVEQMCEALGRTSQEEKAMISELMSGDATLHAKAMDTFTTPFSGAGVEDPDDLSLVFDMQDPDKMEKLREQFGPFSKSIRPAQVQDAIRDLDQNTKTIQKHVEFLQSHSARNSAAIKSTEDRTHRRAIFEDAQTRAMDAKKASLEEQIRKMDSSIKKQVEVLTATFSESGTDMSTLAGIVGNISSLSQGRDEPEVDQSLPFDVLLDKLNALGGELKPPSTDVEAIIKAARLYASEEVFLLVCACRVSLNTVMHETCRNSRSGAASSKADIKVEIQHLVEEIQSLWDEVVPVAHMAVDKQMLGPILARVNADNDSAGGHRTLALDYVRDCLLFMNERLEVLSSRLLAALDYRQSVLTAQSYADDTMRMASMTTPSVGREPFREVDDTPRQKQASKAMTDIEKYARANGLISSSSLFDPSQPPDTQFSRLDELVQQRALKGDAATDAVHRLLESASKARLADLEMGTRVLLESITADSRLLVHGSKSPASALEDEPTEESIGALAEQREDVRAMLKRVDKQLPRDDGPVRSFVPLTEYVERVLFTEGHEASVQISRDDIRHMLGEAGLEFVRRWGDPQFGAK